MSDTSKYSSRYYKLTSNILLEYKYTISNMNNGESSTLDNTIDLNNNTFYVSTNSIDNSKYLYFDKSNLVIPVNKSYTSFVKYENDMYMPTFSETKVTPDIKNNQNITINMDSIRLHFTSRNIFESYDSLIFQTYILAADKQKVYLSSFRLQRTDSFKLNQNPLLINQQLYTCYIDFKIPSPYYLSTEIDDDTKYLLSYLENPSNPNITNINETKKLNLTKNTPITFKIAGVKTTYNQKGIKYFNSKIISETSIPCADKYKSVYLSINEASDGDYFIIKPHTPNNKLSFSDYIYQLSENSPENIIIMYEISLNEHFLDLYNHEHTETTHTEHFIMSAALVSDTDDDKIVVNENRLDDVVLYRPICKYSSRCVCMTIDVTMKIINIIDNTTIIKTASLNYDTPSKYGKKMTQIVLGDPQPVVNVFNRRRDVEVDGDYNTIRITVGSGVGGNSSNTSQSSSSIMESNGVSVEGDLNDNKIIFENHQHQITAMVDFVNIGVSVEQISSSTLGRYTD